MCPDELFVYGRINGLNGLKEKEQDKDKWSHITSQSEVTFLVFLCKEQEHEEQDKDKSSCITSKSEVTFLVYLCKEKEQDKD